MGRYDLAHVDPSETGFDALGKGVAEGKTPEGAPPPAMKYLSKGLTRSRTDNLVMMRAAPVASAHPETTDKSEVRMAYSNSRAESGAANVAALKAELVEPQLSPTEKLEAQQWSKAGTAAATSIAPTKAERRAEAKAKGYEGEMCSECGNFTLVRNGTCMKCDTCGSTTGCS
jgi:ribonucleoside-diphosphate reductase alpha chain